MDSYVIMRIAVVYQRIQIGLMESMVYRDGRQDRFPDRLDETRILGEMTSDLIGTQTLQIGQYALVVDGLYRR